MLLNKDLVRNKLIWLKREFLQRKHVKHVIIDNFLDDDVYKDILKDIEHGRKTIIGDTESRQIVHIKWDMSHKLYNMYTSSVFSKFISFFFEEQVFPERENWRVWLFPSFLTSFFYRKGFFYRRNISGAFLDWHTDGPIEKIAGSFILYLNDDWKKSDGWELQLWMKKWDIVEPYTTIDPLGNRLVLLKCEKDISWHRVLPTKKDRYFIHDQLLKEAKS